jgi:oligopeptide/dipeptide ABC transporter ATP-binding protein
MRLIASAGRFVEGEIHFASKNLLSLSEVELRAIRGDRISMIFQEPMTSLNPVFSVGAQIAEVFEIHRRMPRRQAMQNAVEMLERVGISSAQERANTYPHQLSGGMRQRVMIAMALALKPDLLIADEPTTALDVTIQAQIMTLMKELQKEMGMGIMLITHDLGVVAETCDDVVVMYGGTVVESGPTDVILSAPKHPYTKGLLDSIPSIHRRERLNTIPGLVPNLMHLPQGCRFQDRCSRAIGICRQPNEPALIEIVPGRHLRCFNPMPEESKPT